MTAVLDRAAPPAPRLRRDHRRWAWGLGGGALVIWSLAATGAFSGTVNGAGAAAFGRFAAAALAPATDAALLAALAGATLVTLCYAAVGAALAVTLGALGALLVSRATWGRHRLGWTASRAVLAVPRGLHEAVWGLLLLNLLGLDPWVAVLAIALPAGAVSAKVFADLLDEVPHDGYSALRAAGAGPVAATLYALAPPAAGRLLSYACYRFECAVRSAVVLGLVGAGGLGHQLMLSFTSLRWDEVWSAVYALAGLCLLAEIGGRTLRRRLATRDGTRGSDGVLRAAAVGTGIAVGAAAWQLSLSPAALLADRTQDQVAYVLAAAWPPDTDATLLGTIGTLAVETVQMSVVAVAVAAAGALTLAGFAAGPRPGAAPWRRPLARMLRVAFLLLRAVPAPVWALVALFVLLPGPLPGALALGVYTLGVLGRLVAETVEELDRRPVAALEVAGAPSSGSWLYGVLPGLAGPVLALALYRWEVVIRDTVLIGLLGTGGIGVLLSARTAAFDWAAVTTVLAAIVLLTLGVDLVGDRARAALR